MADELAFLSLGGLAAALWAPVLLGSISAAQRSGALLVQLGVPRPLARGAAVSTALLVWTAYLPFYLLAIFWFLDSGFLYAGR